MKENCLRHAPYSLLLYKHARTNCRSKLVDSFAKKQFLSKQNVWVEIISRQGARRLDIF